MKSTIFTLISKPQIYPFQDRFGVGETRQQNDDIRTTEILENADHTTQDLSPTLSKLVKQKIKIFALYGQEDVLYSAEQIAVLQKIICSDLLKNMENCSHPNYVDHQITFIEQLKLWLLS